MSLFTAIHTRLITPTLRFIQVMPNRIKRFVSGSANPLIVRRKSQSTSARYNETLRVLNQLKNRRQFLSIQVTNSAARELQRYQSLILDIDAFQGTITIDDVFPHSEKQDVQVGDDILVSHRSSGVQISFESQILTMMIEKNLPVYKISIPDALQEGQRRRYFRISPGINSGVKLHFVSDSPQACHVLNMSGSGIAFKMEGDHTDWVEKTKEIKICQLEIPDHDTIHCSILIRSYDYLARQEMTKVGGQFIGLDKATENKLNQYIATLQRKQLKEQFDKFS